MQRRSRARTSPSASNDTEMLIASSSKRFVVAACLLLACCSLGVSAAPAQQRVPGQTLPSSAQSSQPDTPAESDNNPPAATGGLSGTVLDTNGNVLQGANVTLASPSGAVLQTEKSGNDGQFAFTNLPADAYKITVSAPGMNTFSSPQIALQPGEFRVVPSVRLSLSAVSTNVTVNGDKVELSKEQVQIAVHQRVLGVIPNFYSSYDWNAPPMLAKQKFHLSLRSIVDPVSILAVAGLAGAEQYQGVFPGFGSGWEGYAKRFGAAMANHVTGNLLGGAVYPSIFHQDPRYFYNGKGSIRSRAFYAVAAEFITRSDSGKREPNYSSLLGSFSAAGISNLYYPQADRGASLVLLNGFAGIGADAAANLIREFVLKRFTSHVPKGANGQP